MKEMSDDAFLLWCLVRDILDNAYGDYATWKFMALSILKDNFPEQFMELVRDGVKMTREEWKQTEKFRQMSGF